MELLSSSAERKLSLLIMAVLDTAIFFFAKTMPASSAGMMIGDTMIVSVENQRAS